MRQLPPGPRIEQSVGTDAAAMMRSRVGGRGARTGTRGRERLAPRAAARFVPGLVLIAALSLDVAGAAEPAPATPPPVPAPAPSAIVPSVPAPSAPAPSAQPVPAPPAPA